MGSVIEQTIDELDDVLRTHLGQYEEVLTVLSTSFSSSGYHGRRRNSVSSTGARPLELVIG